MRVISAGEAHAALAFDRLIERLRRAFRSGGEAPLRHRHIIETTADEPNTLLLMPAWRSGGPIGVKVVAVSPAAAAQGRGAVSAVFMLLDGLTGAPRALIDGAALTVRRTAAASALAANYLARPDSGRLLMVGAGDLAPHLIEAHCATRPIRHVLIWNRTPKAAEKLAKSLKLKGVKVEATDMLEDAARGADIISCATLSREPLIRGSWLRPGAHLDLVGAFRPDMREADDDCLRRARVFVDTRAGAIAEAGEIVQGIESGALRPDDIAADLFELTRGERAGRRFYDQITLFKSVGTAIEDLAAAELAYEDA